MGSQPPSCELKGALDILKVRLYKQDKIEIAEKLSVKKFKTLENLPY